MDKQQAFKDFYERVRDDMPTWVDFFDAGWEARETQPSPTDVAALFRQAIKHLLPLIYYSHIHTVKGVRPAEFNNHETELKEAQKFVWDNCDIVNGEYIPKLFNPSGAAPAFKCPSCGKPWDTEKHKACECGATISAGAAPQAPAGPGWKGENLYRRHYMDFT